MYTETKQWILQIKVEVLQIKVKIKTKESKSQGTQKVSKTFYK